MNRSILHILSGIIPAAVAASVMMSCSAKDDAAVPDADGGAAITVSAQVAREISSRAYQERGAVSDGVYYLTYNTTVGSERAVATVDFQKPEAPGMGIVTAPDGNELKWDMVGAGANPTFYLDNVPLSLDANSNDKLNVTFPDDTNPFRAGLFDDRDGSNDLLWGSQQATRNDKRIDFDLHHNMSRVKVVVTTDEEFAEDSELDLTDAMVEITSLVHTPVSYSRIDGTLSLPEDPDYEPLVMVKSGDAELSWKTVETDDNNEALKVYTTKDFVLPPQRLLDNEARPRLRIELPNGRVYSGILPHAMEVDYYPDDDDNVLYPATLSFLKEHILTIRTKITADPPQLEFMPVTVVEWVDKGSFTLAGNQAGIYTYADFMNLVANYETYNEFQLSRYGYVDGGTGKWRFNFWHSVSLIKSEIEGRMEVKGDKKDYEFVFNNYTNEIADSPTSDPKILADEEGEQLLYDIVSGKSSNP